MERAIIYLKVFLHLHRYVYAQHTLKSLRAAFGGCQLLPATRRMPPPHLPPHYPVLAEDSQEMQHKKGLDGDLQPSPTLQ